MATLDRRCCTAGLNPLRHFATWKCLPRPGRLSPENVRKAIWRSNAALSLKKETFFCPPANFHAWVAALPDCHSWGQTKEEALANIKEAAELYIESMIAHGDALPIEAYEPTRKPEGEEITLGVP